VPVASRPMSGPARRLPLEIRMLGYG
jgi:hypothetical protein